jgi:hypothetical protein
MSDTTVVFLMVPAVFVVMLLMLEIGRRIGTRSGMQESDAHRDNRILVESAFYGLLALLIAFTVSGAATRFETRRVLTVQEANAIGTAHLRLDVLPAAAQPDLREKFRRYTEARLAVFRLLPDLDASNAASVRAGELQQAIWRGAIAALREAPQAATMLLLPALNDMIDVTTSRDIAAKTHTPIVILCAIGLLALFCCLLAGHALAGGNPLASILRMVGFALVVTLAIYVIIDLDYPRVGFIRLDYVDEAFVDLLTTMK